MRIRIHRSCYYFFAILISSPAALTLREAVITYLTAVHREIIESNSNSIILFIWKYSSSIVKYLSMYSKD